MKAVKCGGLLGSSLGKDLTFPLCFLVLFRGKKPKEPCRGARNFRCDMILGVKKDSDVDRRYSKLQTMRAEKEILWKRKRRQPPLICCVVSIENLRMNSIVPVCVFSLLAILASVDSELTECEVATYLENAGFPSSVLPKMVCTSYYESTWNCNAIGQDSGSQDIGLMQINTVYWCSGGEGYESNGCNVPCSDLTDCQTNANCAYIVYQQKGITAWDGYTSHESTCNSYQLNCTSSTTTSEVNSNQNYLRSSLMTVLTIGSLLFLNFS